MTRDEASTHAADLIDNALENGVDGVEVKLTLGLDGDWRVEFMEWLR